MSADALTSTTIELFRDDATLRDCSAQLTVVDERGVQLDRTVFYPQGGGQAGDRGELLLSDGAVLVIIDTRKGDGAGQIIHVPAPGQETLLARLASGSAVTARIDWVRRHRHMRFHTATHLLCALVPHPVDGCSITADYARLDFHMNEPLDKAVLSAGIAELVGQARKVSHRWITDAELDANPGLVRSMSVQPPRGSGRVRLLEVDGVDLQPCGGTHVANTAEIGAVVVTKIEKKSAMTRRVILGFAD
ncbi:MAG TPA: alanyl-tRNA editing protein [Albitalea sp.]|nr:alanyl-tRNA editing protein [Albitalea sp.]